MEWSIAKNRKNKIILEAAALLGGSTRGPVPKAKAKASASNKGSGSAFTCRWRGCAAGEKGLPTHAGKANCFKCGRPRSEALSPSYANMADLLYGAQRTVEANLAARRAGASNAQGADRRAGGATTRGASAADRRAPTGGPGAAEEDEAANAKRQLERSEEMRKAKAGELKNGPEAPPKPAPEEKGPANSVTSAVASHLRATADQLEAPRHQRPGKRARPC